MTKKIKRIVIIVLAIALIIALIPVKLTYRDGGSVEYRALLYSVTKYHRLSQALWDDSVPYTTFYEGWRVEILRSVLHDDIERIETEQKIHQDRFDEYYESQGPVQEG